MKPLRARAAGMTMVELMVAMVIGLFLIGAVISLFAASKRSYTETESFARLGENGRFALQAFTADLRLAGFFGGVLAGDVEPDDALTNPAGDCSNQGAAYDVDNYIFVARANAAGVALGCIDDAVPNTDVVVIKSVRPRPLTDGDRYNRGDDDGTIDAPEGLNGQTTYVMANPAVGILFDGADPAPSIAIGGDVPQGEAWEYKFQIYYVRAGTVPALARKVLRWNGGAMAVTTEDIVEGIENLRIMVGIDTDTNREVDTYVDSTAAIDWSGVESMQVYLLVRSIDRDPNFADPAVHARTFQLGNANVAVPGDGFRRLVMQNSVSLRNAKLLVRGY